MITPLDHKVFSPTHSTSLAFPGHAGEGMTLQRVTRDEHFHYNSHPNYFAPKTRQGCGCDLGYYDRIDGSFTTPFAVALDRPNRRFSS